MATGHTHDRITIICLPLLVGASLLVTRSVESTLWATSSFLFSGLMFGPDLDIHSKQSIRWGWFQWLWQPYRRWIPHRSLLSHGPIIGTVIRLLYLGCWLVCLSFLYQSILQLMGQPQAVLSSLKAMIKQVVDHHQPVLITAFIGLELGAMSHYAADICSSKMKQWRKRSTRSATSLRPKKKIKTSR